MLKIYLQVRGSVKNLIAEIKIPEGLRRYYTYFHIIAYLMHSCLCVYQ